MFFSTITIRYDPEAERIDDASFQEFARDKEVLSVKEHFFIYRELPHLALCVTWRPPSAGRGAPAGAREEWRKRLKTPADEELFDRLRKWRAEKAKAEGIPAYAIMTNRQLAETAAGRPGSMAALQRIGGFGPARAEKFGKEILGIIAIK